MYFTTPRLLILMSVHSHFTDYLLHHKIHISISPIAIVIIKKRPIITWCGYMRLPRASPFDRKGIFTLLCCRHHHHQSNLPCLLHSSIDASSLNALLKAKDDVDAFFGHHHQTPNRKCLTPCRIDIAIF